jgi:hypothetical protein
MSEDTRTSFARLIEDLRGQFALSRATARVARFAVENRSVELALIRVGADEWAAVTAAGRVGALPARHLGLGTLVEGNGGWGLRLVLPVAQVDARTFAAVMTQLAGEARALARRPVAAHRTDVYVGMFS